MEFASLFAFGAIGLIVAIAFPKYLELLPGSRWFWPYGRRASRFAAIAGASACIVFALSSRALIPAALEIPVFVGLGLMVLCAAIYDFAVLPRTANEDANAMPGRYKRTSSDVGRKKRKKRRKRA